MVFLTLTQKLNRSLGPFLLRHGLTLRYTLGGGVIRDSPLLDALLLIPIGQKLVSLEARQEMRDLEQGETSVMAQMFFQSESTKPDTKVDTQSRLKILESFLRPVLVPTNQWKDVKRWQFQNRFIKWAREEILHAKFSPDLRASMAAYPDIPNSLQMQASRGSVFRHASGSDYDSQHAGRKRPKAPKTSNLQQALSMQDWSERKDTAAVSKPMTTLVQKLDGEIVKLGGGGFRLAYASDSADISEMQIEDILELAGGHVVNCGPFNALCEEVNMYQFWTEEYIEGLGRYLGKRASRFNGETIVLDVGAGDGVLAVHLKDYFTRSRSARPSRQKLKTRSAVPDPIKPTQAVTEPPRIIATDDGSWSIGTKAPVEALGVEEALSKYCDESKLLQVIVLCSWMPMSEDWTSLFRMSKVDEYILIGECDDGTCGDNWETWGNYSYLEEAETGEKGGCLRPYEVDNYKRKELKHLLPFQFSRFDCSVSKAGATISFRREN